MHRYRNAAGALSAGLVCLSLCGCGPSFTLNEKVAGTLKMNGKGLPNVRVDFYPQFGAQTAPASGGFTDENGRFTLQCTDGRPGAVVGRHKVVLLRGRAAASDEERQASGAPTKLAPEFPASYSVAAKTPLEIDVTVERTDYELIVVP